MLCSRFKQILNIKTTPHKNIQCRCLTKPNFIIKKCRRDSIQTSVFRDKTDVLSMSSIRFVIKDLRIYRFWSVWTRNVNVGSVVRRCRRDRSVREVFQSFRHSFLRTPKSLLISAAAALYVEEDEDDDDDDDDDVIPCKKNITDEELQLLLKDLETIQELSNNTIYCRKCKLRLAIDNKKLSGINYCTCRVPIVPDTPEDGWIPYMEAEDVIIWRKEYKPGQGLFVYKVYGRYKDITAQDFAAIQVDGGYRKVWDTAVAALTTVERTANGVMDQAVLHWEVLWPRLFANRDYVYIRRHKEFDLVGSTIVPNTASEIAQSDTEGAKPATLDQKQNESDMSDQKDREPKKSLPETNQNESDQKSESTDGKSVTSSIDDYGNKVTIVRKKRKKLDEVTAPSADVPSPGDKLASDDTSSGDKVTPTIPIEVERPSVHSNAKRKAQQAYEDSEQEKTKVNKAYVIISRSCTHPKVPEGKQTIRVTEYWSNMVIRTLDGAEHAGMEFVLTYYDEPAVGGLPSAVSSFATGRAAPAFLARMRIAAMEYAEFIKRRGSVDAPNFKTRATKMSYKKNEIIKEEDMESSKLGPDLEAYKPEKTTTSERGTQTEESTFELNDREKLLRKVNSNEQKKEEEIEESEKADSEENLSWWRQLYPFHYFAS